MAFTLVFLATRRRLLVFLRFLRLEEEKFEEQRVESGAFARDFF